MHDKLCLILMKKNKKNRKKYVLFDSMLENLTYFLFFSICELIELEFLTIQQSKYKIIKLFKL